MSDATDRTFPTLQQLVYVRLVLVVYDAQVFKIKIFFSRVTDVVT